MEFNQIQKRISKAINDFQRTMPAAQKAAMSELLLQLKKLDLDDNGNVKASIANLNQIGQIRNKLTGIIVSDEYLGELKKYVQTFTDITKMQNEYWNKIEPEFKPRAILKEIRKQAVGDTVAKLTEAGIGENIGGKLTDILRTNITSGGSYKNLEQQLRDSLMNNRTGEGTIEKYTKQITTDAVNQYSANYSQMVSQDLGAEWFEYQGSDITTTRCFCDAMTDGDNAYFHVTEIPRILRGEGLTCKKDGMDVPVAIYEKTKLPYGMIAGTDANNFFIRRGGYNCGHQIRPILRVSTIPQGALARAEATPEYQAWMKAKKDRKGK